MLSIVTGCVVPKPTSHSASQCLVKNCSCCQFSSRASVCSCGHGLMYHRTEEGSSSRNTASYAVGRHLERAENLDRRAAMKEAKGGVLKDQLALQEAFQLLVATLEAYEEALLQAEQLTDEVRAREIKSRMRDVVSRCDSLSAALRTPTPAIQGNQHLSRTPLKAASNPPSYPAYNSSTQAVEITDDSMRLRSPKKIVPSISPFPTIREAQPVETVNSKTSHAIQKKQPQKRGQPAAYHPLTPSELTAIIKRSRQQNSLSTWRLDQKGQ